MKFRISHNLLAVTAAVVVSLAFALPGDAQQRRAGARVDAGSGGCIGGAGTLFDQIEPTFLTAAEASDLVYLREEEKLARDVYLTLRGRALSVLRGLAPPLVERAMRDIARDLADPGAPGLVARDQGFQRSHDLQAQPCAGGIVVG